MIRHLIFGIRLPHLLTNKALMDVLTHEGRETATSSYVQQVRACVGCWDDLQHYDRGRLEEL